MPIVIEGTNAILPPGARLLAPGGRVRVRFGEPIPVRDRDEEALIAEVSAFFSA